jgi:hypothetical protein
LQANVGDEATWLPDAVADFFTPDGTIVINNGQPWCGRAGVAAMTAGFFGDIPDLCLVCDGVRAAGAHVAYLWTFMGTHLASGNAVRVTGWEEWDVDPQGAIVRSCGRAVGSILMTIRSRRQQRPVDLKNDYANPSNR